MVTRLKDDRHDDRVDYAVIGDSHECVEELSRLVTRLETEIPGVKIVHCGDYLDKGKNTRAMIEYLHERYLNNNDVFVRGNHEKFVFGRIEGILGPLGDDEKERLVFGSQEVLLANPDLAGMFKNIYSRSYPAFYIYPWVDTDGENPVFVTHAPCPKIHLGKTDPNSVIAQGNYRMKDRDAPVVEDLAWFYDEAEDDGHTHIFGHMCHSGKTLAECTYKNKIFLDTGCVYGNGLSAVHVRDGRIVNYFFEPSTGSRQPGYILPPPLGLR